MTQIFLMVISTFVVMVFLLVFAVSTMKKYVDRKFASDHQVVNDLKNISGAISRITDLVALERLRMDEHEKVHEILDKRINNAIGGQNE